MEFNIDEARERWPSDLATLPAEAQMAYAMWMGVTPSVREDAIKALTDFSRPSAPYRKEAKCRDLVLLRSPFPRRAGAPQTAVLTPAQVAQIGTPVPATPTPAEEEGPSELVLLRRMVEEQQQQLEAQQTTIKQLFDLQASVEEGDVTSSYAVVDEVLEFLGKGDKGCSWMNILPLSKKDRARMVREHGGSFSDFPPDLDLIESTKNRKDVQKVQISLQKFAQDEVSRYMKRNGHTIKMCATVHSRIVEMRRAMEFSLTEDPSQDVVPSSDVLEFLRVVDGVSSTALQLAVDTQTHLRLAVSSKIEKAMGVAHLRQDPLKKKKEDFIAPDTYRLIEEAAVKKQNLQWAQEALKKGIAVGSKHGATPRAGLSHGRPSSKTSGGGRRNATFEGYTKGGGGKGSGRQNPETKDRRSTKPAKP